MWQSGRRPEAGDLWPVTLERGWGVELSRHRAWQGATTVCDSSTRVWPQAARLRPQVDATWLTDAEAATF